ncbi:MAG: DNA gyrase inhibitor YacG [Alphaproteobacteria bacterium]
MSEDQPQTNAKTAKVLPLKAKDQRNLCPECARTTVDAFRPFCSKRCANQDLGNWFTESYKISGRPLGDEDD